MKGKLILADQNTFEGDFFGAITNISGEVVFNTGMVGYVESLTDPSYYGQILVLTYPLVGNYGIPDTKYWESKKIQVKGVIVQNYIDTPSHFESQKTLSDWLKKDNIPGLFNIDTRFLVRKLRERGVMLGRIESGESGKGESYDPNKENVLPFVSVDKPQTFGEGKKHIILIDCGAKSNIIKSFLKRKVKITVVPWNFNPIKNNLNFDGVMISNGPGDPKQAKETIDTIRQLIDENVPTFGICLGSQLLGLAAGADTYKLKFGHRGQNQPVKDLISKKAIITSQNHGFAISSKTLSNNWQEWFINLNDGTNEGVRHVKKPFLSVQFHPEASPGPTDGGYLFDEFLTYL
ncbi:glutamine-hydrolyzing carbamoyl-phosphate synthase small subunit [Candidatus Daviesbacteria bacterium]|nr:glutamine-hydrolyzing carbamoyl-phosphate synthase small subunit [Candidatus Daviesbacteria bacterium]